MNLKSSNLLFIIRILTTLFQDEYPFLGITVQKIPELEADNKTSVLPLPNKRKIIYA